MTSSLAPRHGRLYRRMAADAAALEPRPGPASAAPITEADLAARPAAAQRYLRFMAVTGRPPDWSFTTHFTGRFRLRPRLPWLRCQAWQYSTCPDVTRLYHMRITVAGLLPMTGRDAYSAGQGRMYGKLAGLVPVADGSGPEYDVSELVTYLNDAVLLAPSMLLALPVTWTAVSDSSFDLTLTDAGHEVTARVLVDGRGAPVEFSTDDRWCDLPGGLVRTRWSTPVQGWMKINGRWQPRWGAAIWHLPGGPFCYAEFRFTPGATRYNVTPAELSPHEPGSQPSSAELAPSLELPTVMMTRQMLPGSTPSVPRQAARPGEPAAASGSRS
jgi:Family of unknown function (DUF6544)